MCKCAGQIVMVSAQDGEATRELLSLHCLPEAGIRCISVCSSKELLVRHSPATGWHCETVKDW